MKFLCFLDIQLGNATVEFLNFPLENFLIRSIKKKFRRGKKVFQEAIFGALFTENSNEINLQFFLYDQVEELNFRKKNFIF
jgi:hypothetical protein